MLNYVSVGFPISLCSQLFSVQINSSPPVHNNCLFADDIFRCIFVNENFCILGKISLTFVPKDPINNKPALAPNKRQAIILTNADLIH